MRERLRRLRLDAMLAVQSGVAAGLAWFVAYDRLHHVRPFFAPIAAVIVLSASVGQRWRRALELVVGVALGIAVADLLILVIGVGMVQIAAVVTLAILTAVFAGGGSVAMGQAAASAVLVATLAPPTSGLYLDRFVDALVGGVVGLLVMTLLLPFNPLTRVRRAAGRALDQLAEALAATAEALRRGEPDLARQALAVMRATDSDHHDLQASLEVGKETATLAPMRWRSKGALDRYVVAAVHVERATRNARVLARRAASVLADGEPVPEHLPVAIARLGEAVATVRRVLDEGADSMPAKKDSMPAKKLVLDAVELAGRAYREGAGFSGSVIVAQVRSAATDLLRGMGVPEARAERLVRRAARPEAAAGPDPARPDPARPETATGPDL